MGTSGVASYRRLLPLVLSFVLAAGASEGASGGGDAPAAPAGAYIAGRYAIVTSDYQAAADYLTQALAGDPTNSDIAGSALLSYIALGDWDRARAIAATLSLTKQTNSLVDLVTLAGLVQDEKYADAVAALDKGRTAGPLVDGIFRGWALVGAGQMGDALKAFDKVAEDKGLRPFALQQKALALASVGDFEAADKILSSDDAKAFAQSRRGLIAHAQILSQLERDKDALKLLDEMAGPTPQDRELASIRKALVEGKTVPFTLIRSAKDGLAELFLAVGSILSTEPAPKDLPPDQPRPQTADVLMFARTAKYLRPDLADADLLIAATVQEQKQNALAISVLRQIDPAGPMGIEAQYGLANALVSDGQLDEAIQVLKALTAAVPDRPDTWAALGDVQRRAERYADGADAYSRALATIGAPKTEQWVLFYARGICYERMKDWTKAEADFRKALELSPDQPDVLNYLGYSLLEKTTNYTEALQMIAKAAKAVPDSGAIADSLGWAYYRTGDYPKAEAEMERAINLMPNDPVVNDHLGDVYWMVGRKTEAVFQWRRAQSFKPDPEDAARIRRKLEVGLDAVLKEEAAKGGNGTAGSTTNGNG